MTVSYSHEVFTSSGYGIFLKLLFRWKGSIYKLVWRDLIVYIVIYYFLSLLYRFVLNENAKITFENISLYCGNFADLIPITFVLGFYVSLIINRWWNMFLSVPWPDSAAVWVSTCIHGHDDRGRLMRRTIVRYINLCVIIALRFTSLPVKKRFPTLDHLVEAGILTESEKQIMSKMDAHVSHCKYWMPLVWAGAIATRARKENRIMDDYALKSVIEQLDKFRSYAGGLLNYDWVTVPLVYTQVVTLAVYTFLLSTLMGRQFLDPTKKYPGHDVDLVVPIFTFLQFFFYMGWLKVAEALINPFGEDEDDFEMNWIIDRNIQVSYLIVDEMHAEHPEMVRDQFWDDIFPELPYTAAAEQFKTDAPIGAAEKFEVPESEAEFLPLNQDEEEEEEEEEEGDPEDDDLCEVVVNESKLSNGINRPTSPIAILGAKLRHKRKKENSVSTLGNNSVGGSHRTSMTSIIHKALTGNSSIPRLNHDAKQGSSLSIFSKASKTSKASKASKTSKPSMSGGVPIPLHGGRQRRKRQISKTASSISRLSYQPQSPSAINPSKDMGGQDEMFKMSSTSSINSHLEGPLSESDFSTHPYNSKMDVSDILKHDMNVFSNSRLAMHVNNSRNLKHTINNIPSSFNQRKTRKTQETHFQNKVLRRKLEAIQSLQADIMRYLDEEIESGKHFEHNGQQEPHDPTDMIRALEQKTEDLRYALITRDRHLSEEEEDHNEEFERFSSSFDNQGHTSLNPMDESQQGSIISMIKEPPSPQMIDPQPLVKVEVDVPPLISIPDDVPDVKTISLEPTTEMTDFSTDDNNEMEEMLMMEEEEEAGKEEPESEEQEGESGNEDGVIYENIDDVSSEDKNSMEEDVVTDQQPPQQQGYDNPLSTIEEQPELGYQSDSSETDFLIPMDCKGNKHSDNGSINGHRKSSKAGMNLPTVPEESYTKSESEDNLKN